jgi:hypothetical protein
VWCTRTKGRNVCGVRELRGETCVVYEGENGPKLGCGEVG